MSEPNGPLLPTPLHSWHGAHGAKLVEFAGWSMPVYYGSIVDEHRATRGEVGVFDVSHMGRLAFEGADSGAYLDGLLTRKVAGLPEGAVRYSLMVREDGGILDDVLIYRVPAQERAPASHLLVVNASNREKILAWLDAHPATGDVRRVDRTCETAMLAVQGPRALACVQPLVDVDCRAMRYYTTSPCRLQGLAGAEGAALVSRTGYTGEDGVELIVAAGAAERLWQRLVDAGARPMGLGARDTLRLEAAMPLYGHELSESINPYEAGLGFAVQLEGREFVGREALAAIAAAGPRRRRIGLELDARRVPREHFPVLCDGQVVGEVTSGTFSPTLDRPIAMALVDSASADAAGLPDSSADRWAIDIRGTATSARRVELPFYRRPG